MHLCTCVSEEGGNGEGAGSEALSLLSLDTHRREVTRVHCTPNRHGVSRRTAKEQPANMNDITALHTTSYNQSYLPLPDLAASIPCPDSDLCDTRRSAPAITRFCPTLGWSHLVKSVPHRAAVHVALAASIVLNVPDMWSREEDNSFAANYW